MRPQALQVFGFGPRLRHPAFSGLHHDSYSPGRGHESSHHRTARQGTSGAAAFVRPGGRSTCCGLCFGKGRSGTYGQSSSRNTFSVSTSGQANRAVPGGCPGMAPP